MTKKITKSKQRAGKIYEAEIASTLRAYRQVYQPNFVWHRIPDVYDHARNFCPKCQKPFTSQYVSVKNPADFFFIYKGRITFIEAKSSMQERYRLEWIKPHQIDYLIQINKAGGRGFIMIGYRGSLVTCRKKNSKMPKKNRSWILTPECIKSQIEKGKKSLSWEEINKFGVELERNGGIWDIDILLK